MEDGPLRLLAVIKKGNWSANSSRLTLEVGSCAKQASKTASDTCGPVAPVSTEKLHEFCGSIAGPRPRKCTIKMHDAGHSPGSAKKRHHMVATHELLVLRLPDRTTCLDDPRSQTQR